MAQIIDDKIIKFEKDEIKHYFNILNVIFINDILNNFETGNIKISNIGNKKFKNLCFVIDTDNFIKRFIIWER